mgnify:CR=1 FL=1
MQKVVKMTNFHKKWNDFLKNADIYGKINENSEKMLWEVTEDELAHIENAIENMDPDDLAFNSMFDGEMRRIIPFSTLDPDSESGKFIKFWDKLHQGHGPKGQELGWKWKPDFSTGKVSRNRPIYKTPNDYHGASPVPGKESPKRSPEMMKIGKLLNKIASLAEKYSEASKAWVDDAEASHETVKRLEKSLYNLVGNIQAMQEIIKNPEKVRKLARWWELTGAALFKGDKNAGKDDTYSIIVTRSPLDILRAGDFKNIQSCHSPPSRGGGGSYYKCIVAEAHGHGAGIYCPV